MNMLDQFRSFIQAAAAQPAPTEGLLSPDEAPASPVRPEVEEAARMQDGIRRTLGSVPGSQAAPMADNTNLEVYRAFSTAGSDAIGSIIENEQKRDQMDEAVEQAGLMAPQMRPDPAPEYVDPNEGRSRVDIDLDTIMVSEGGFQQDPDDSGNYVNGKLIGTNRGVTPAALAKFRGIDASDVTVEMIKDVTDAEARDIFKQDYYYGPKIDQLPENIQDTVFDMYINSGANAIKILQRMVGADDDGVIGPQTLAAVADANITRDAYADARIEYYKRISQPGSKNAKYRQGWINRANKYRD